MWFIVSKQREQHSVVNNCIHDPYRAVLHITQQYKFYISDPLGMGAELRPASMHTAKRRYSEKNLYP